MIPDIAFPRGVRDLMPNEALFREELIRKIEDTFRRFGFLAIDTPVFESMEVLRAKYLIGEEEAKLIYELKYEGLALRYDHTVSLARYYSMHQDLSLPFKRYVIGKCWRREEPQRLRYREFTQADIDILGGRTSAADAEAMAVPSLLFDSLGVQYRVVVNSRKFVDAMLGSLGVKPELFGQIMRAVDKLDKLGRDGVLDLLQKVPLDRDTITKIDTMINMQGSNDEKLAYVEKIMDKKTACDEIRETLKTLPLYGIRGEAVIDFSLMRGLDYYTDIVFEFKLLSGQTKSSIGGGGRYDNMINLFSKRQVAAVGSSIGIDRLLDVLDFSSSIKHTFANVFVANIKDENYGYALKTANALRAAGIAVDLNMASRNISNQLSYANALKFKYVLIVGDEEEKSNKVKLRNLIDGAEGITTLEEAIKAIRESK